MSQNRLKIDLILTRFWLGLLAELHPVCHPELIASGRARKTLNEVFFLTRLLAVWLRMTDWVQLCEQT